MLLFSVNLLPPEVKAFFDILEFFEQNPNASKEDAFIRFSDDQHAKKIIRHAKEEAQAQFAAPPKGTPRNNFAHELFQLAEARLN